MTTKITYYFAKLIKNYIKPKTIYNSYINNKAKVCSGSELHNVSIGQYSYIGHDCKVNNCDIGNFCSIASNVTIGGSSHPLEWVSTSPVFHTKRNVLGKSFSDKRIDNNVRTSVGHDVWIGGGVIVKAGISIGTGSVIGMGSVVTKDVPPYEVWAGNPAKCIKKRFDESTAQELINSKWWEFDDKRLAQLGAYFDNPIEFLNELYRMDEVNGEIPVSKQ